MCLFICFAGIPLFGADLQKAQKDFLSGNYSNCIRVCEQAIRQNDFDEEWLLLLAQSLLTIGRYPDARSVVSNALPRYSTSVRLRLLGHEAFLHNGQTARARELIDEINELVGQRPWAYRDAPNLVAVGKAALLLGADPRRVLERLFDQAKKADPKNREAYLASGEVALDKHDYELAAKIFQEGLKKSPDDPDLHLGVAKAYTPSDRPQMIRSLQAALKQNTNHVPSLLWLTDHLIDAEEYVEAEKLLTGALAVNPWQPEAWSYRAVLKHLLGDADGESSARETALKFWKTNPRVDYLIGQKLSQKYRFAEGAACQRRALKFDANFSPSKIQLAQDLLRLGQEDEGWRLADEVNQNDAYDVTAYNLVTLKDSINKFQTLTNADFIVRIAKNEAAIYGQKVLALLERGKSNLCEKFGFKLEKPTIVEIFPEQKDFAVRTFGMPGNPGYLGVCFGSVITANSPAAQTGHPANWEAVLWHEFCHVVTLQMTRNKMPRWLSEGISVYEEKRENPPWG
ncbi:MAG TPA: tetratricopeptide repeat protein, partial [Candidatus Eisenbacteria bacterium]|nr:tetratricopeptide repeat protein [Candidatus Eisenbacteria bacterium]